MDQHRLQSVAHRGTGALAVEEDLHRHIQIGALVHVQMTVAGAGLDGGDGGGLQHSADESGAAPGDEHVDETPQTHHGVGGGVRGVVQEGDAVAVQACLGQGVLHDARQHQIGAEGLLSAPEEGGVAGLEAQRRRVHGDVGPGLIDDAHHAQRHPDLADVEAVGPHHGVHDLPHGVRQGHDLPDALGHAGDALRRQAQPVQHGGAHPALLRLGHIPAVGFQNLALTGLQGQGDGLQPPVLGGRVVQCQLACGLLGLAGQFMQMIHIGRSPFSAAFLGGQEQGPRPFALQQVV